MDSQKATAQTKSRRLALMVLGMHRSGTSALAGVLCKLGAQAPRTLLPNAKDNPKGFWESAEIVRFHDQILASSGSSWSDWERINPDWLDTETAERFLERVPELLRSEFGDAPLLLLKDPRICRLLPFWRKALERAGVEARAIIPLRNPIEVAGSLEERNGFGRNRSLLIWLRHVLEAEYASRLLPRCFVQYSDLLRDWRPQSSRIATELGFKWPRWSGAVEASVDDYLTIGLRHQFSDGLEIAGSSELQSWIQRASSAFAQLLIDKNNAGAQRELDDLREAFDRGASIFGSVVSEHEAQAQRSIAELKKESDARSAAALALESQLGVARNTVAEQEAQRERDVARIAELEQRDALNSRQLTSSASAIENVAAQLALQDRVIGDMRALLAAREADLDVFRSQEAARAEESARAESLSRKVTELVGIGAQQEQHIAELQAQLTGCAGDMDALRSQVSSHAERVTKLREDEQHHLARIADLELRLVEAGKRQEALLKNEAELRKLAQANRSLLEKSDQQDRNIAIRFKEIELLTRSLLDADARLSERDSQIAMLRKQAEALGQQLAALQRGRIWRITAPLRRLVSSAKRLRNPSLKNADAVLLSSSGWFDSEWYLKTYPDVASAGMEPVFHYLEFGAKEGRNPSPEFDTNFYLKTHPDVAESGLNPFVHFILHGCSEERKTRVSSP